ncbi:hypothetical protein [Methylobacterium sp. WL64]|uniref:hypothetical protein n=1 Tax=Methylobacterium sp. WL64 TaxID=2603894 RepID=UPI001AEDC37B|nr:hypothetical protein [Methylobacterium sp. WL64]
MIGGILGALARLTIPKRAVSEETIYKASSLAEIRGAGRSTVGSKAMDDILASVSLGFGRSIHIATLSQETIKASAADHLGFGGYFLFETGDAGITEGINILGKACSLDAAFRLIDIWNTKPHMA